MFAVFCEDPSMAKQDGDEEGYPYNKEHMPWFFDKAAADAVDAVDALANWFFSCVIQDIPTQWSWH